MDGGKDMKPGRSQRRGAALRRTNHHDDINRAFLLTRLPSVSMASHPSLPLSALHFQLPQVAGKKESHKRKSLQDRFSSEELFYPERSSGPVGP